MVLFRHNKRLKGQAYEAIAERYLAQHGLKPVTRNFQCRSGEIDLIMRDQRCWVFVEVKYRRNPFYGSAAEAVNWQKQQKLKRTALFWLQQQGISTEHAEFRFDVIAISGNTPHQTEWLTNTLIES